MVRHNGAFVQSLRALPELLKVAEVAQALRVSRATVYAMLDRGELERVWVGSSIRVPTASLRALLGGQ